MCEVVWRTMLCRNRPITTSATQRMSRSTEDAAASVTELREQEAIEWRRVKEQAQGLERLMRCDPNRHIL